MTGQSPLLRRDSFLEWGTDFQALLVYDGALALAMASRFPSATFKGIAAVCNRTLCDVVSLFVGA